jgi:hypothetical protein
VNRYLERGREDFAATGLSRRRPFPALSLSMIMLAVSCDGNGVTGPSPDPSPHRRDRYDPAAHWGYQASRISWSTTID